MALTALIGCAGSGPPGPLISPTGFVYPEGVPPAETRFSQTASLYVRQQQYERALEIALEGVASDPGNPVHFYLAGVAHARLLEHVQADSMFAVAEGLYPAYELDIEPEREASWGAAFNAGLESYAQGEIAETIELWQGAVSIFDLRPEAHRNLASLLAVEGRYDEAIRTYQGALDGLGRRPATRVLEATDLAERARAGIEIEQSLAQLLLLRERFAEAEPLLRREVDRDPASVAARSDLAAALTGLGRQAEAEAIYADVLSEDGLAATQLFNLGIALFRSGEFTSAADAFKRLTELRPNSRDAWFNYSNSLFASEAWATLAEAGSELVRLDPLGENAWLITARAHLEVGDRDRALLNVERAETAPVFVDELQLRSSANGTRIQGRITGNAAEPGTSLQLRFVFYGDTTDPLGEEQVDIRAPGAGESAPFEVSFPTRAAGYRYEVVDGGT